MSDSRDPRPAALGRRTLATALGTAALLAAVSTGCSADPSPSSPTSVTSIDGRKAVAPRPLAARSPVDVAVYGQPGGSTPKAVLPAVNDLGSPLVLHVLAAREEVDGTWLEVLLPGRPNGHTGWVSASAVTMNEVEHEVHVDLERRELVVRSEGLVVLRTAVAIGDPDHPTPTGRFAITDKLASTDPAGLYGPFAFGLTGRSEVVTEFAGGDGQIGIHGTNDPSSIGLAASHGCIRVPNDVVRVLNEMLALGTPVVIV